MRAECSLSKAGDDSVRGPFIPSSSRERAEGVSCRRRASSTKRGDPAVMPKACSARHSSKTPQNWRPSALLTLDPRGGSHARRSRMTKKSSVQTETLAESTRPCIRPGPHARLCVSLQNEILRYAPAAPERRTLHGRETSWPRRHRRPAPRATTKSTSRTSSTFATARPRCWRVSTSPAGPGRFR